VVRREILLSTATTDDENVYGFQARILASGRLYLESPPEAVRPFFDNQFIINSGRWFGSYFPGHAAVLALALRLGVPDLTGPLQAALTVLLAIGIARRVGGERVAMLTGALLALSPFFVFVSASHLSQPTSTLMLTLFMYGTVRIEESPRTLIWWLVAGCALSYALLTRPQTAVLLSLPFLMRLLVCVLQGRLHPGPAPVAAFLAVLILGCGLIFAANWGMTGHALKTPYQAYWDQGIRWPYPIGPLHTVREISRNLAQLDFWLYGWPLSLVFLPFFRRTGITWTLAVVPAVALLWYGIVAIPTVTHLGPVYYAETIVPMTVLSASGLERVVMLVRERLGDGPILRVLIAWPCALVVSSLLTFTPFQATALRLMAETARAPYDLVEERGLDKAIVFVRSLGAQESRPGAWVIYHRNPSVDMRADRVLFVRDLGVEKDRELLRYLPDRTPYWMGMVNGQLVLRPLER